MSPYIDSLIEKLSLVYDRLFGVSWLTKAHYVYRAGLYWGLLKYYFKNIGIIDFLTLGILAFWEFNLLYLMDHTLREHDGKDYTRYIIVPMLIAMFLIYMTLIVIYLVRFCFAVTMLLILACFVTLYHAYHYNHFLEKSLDVKLSVLNQLGQYELETIAHAVGSRNVYEITKPKTVSFQYLLLNKRYMFDIVTRVNYVGIDQSSEKTVLEFTDFNGDLIARKYLLHVQTPTYQKHLTMLLWMNFQYFRPFSRQYFNPTIFFKNEPSHYPPHYTKAPRSDLTGWNEEALQYGIKCIELMYIINKYKIPGEIGRIILELFVDSNFKIKTSAGIACITKNAHWFFAEKAQKFYNERQMAQFPSMNII